MLKWWRSIWRRRRAIAPVQPYTSGAQLMEAELRRVELVLQAAQVSSIRERSGWPTNGRLLEPDRHGKSDRVHREQRQHSIEIQRRLAVSTDVRLPLVDLCRLFFGVRTVGQYAKSFERFCIVLAMANEFDARAGPIYGQLQGDATRCLPSIDLAIRLWGAAADELADLYGRFAPNAPLIQYQLISLVGDHGNGDVTAGATTMRDRTFKLQRRAIDYILGSNEIDATISGFATITSLADQHRAAAATITPSSVIKSSDMADDDTDQIGQVLNSLPNRTEIDLLAPGNDETRDRIHAFLARVYQDGAPRRPVVWMQGTDGSGRQRLVNQVCRELAIPVLVCSAERLLASDIAIERLSGLLQRELILQRAALCVTDVQRLTADDARSRACLDAILHLTRQSWAPVFLLTDREWAGLVEQADWSVLSLQFDFPSAAQRKLLWDAALAKLGMPTNAIDTTALASQFRLTPGRIRDAVLAATDLARARSPMADQTPAIQQSDVAQACRARAAPNLGRFARKIEPKRTWADLVLAPEPRRQLGEICRQARLRGKVLDDWGFREKLAGGIGVTALFYGPPGTGKTLAAEIIAGALQQDCWTIDLSQVFSKWIGETEKNVSEIFREARNTSAVLCFNEADALLSKRVEVSDANSRFANLQIAHLLQEMELYEGVAILTTNLRENMDDAFVRRLQFVVEFPMPDVAHRLRTWEVTFPMDTTCHEDVDLRWLASEVKLPGGNIRNIALAAAYHAAARGAGEPVTMRDLVRAASREYEKLGRTWSPARPPVQ